MTKSRGLTNSVLGAHFGTEIPTVIRRSTPIEQAPGPEQGRAVPQSSEDIVRAPSAMDPSDTLDSKFDNDAPREASEPTQDDERRPSALDVVTRARDEAANQAEREVASTSSRARSDRRPSTITLDSKRSLYRVGTREQPYERVRKGGLTEKVSFTATAGFNREIERYLWDNDIDLRKRSEWFEEVLRKAMRTSRKRP